MEDKTLHVGRLMGGGLLGRGTVPVAMVGLPLGTWASREGAGMPMQTEAAKKASAELHVSAKPLAVWLMQMRVSVLQQDHNTV